MNVHGVMKAISNYHGHFKENVNRVMTGFIFTLDVWAELTLCR